MVDAVIESLDEIEGIIKVFKNYSDKPLYIFSFWSFLPHIHIKIDYGTGLDEV